MKIKIFNVPGYSHEYSVSETTINELDNNIIETDYKLGINKHLIVTKKEDNIISVKFNNTKKIVKLPATWFKIID